MRVEVLIDSLYHDGRRRAPGEVIEVERPEALLALGAVRPAEAVSAVANPALDGVLDVPPAKPRGRKAR